MKYKNMIAVGAVVLLFLFNTAHAEPTVWYVHPDSALSSIQTALDACADNDIVLVGPGTYYENIVWPSTQGIHLLSELGPHVTIIDGDTAGRVIEITTAVDTSTIIRGFTIQNGYLAGAAGGGIYCNGSSPSISNNVISDNGLYFGAGAGIFCAGNSTAIIRDNVITRNIAGFAGGGGIACFGSSPIITGNAITENESFGGGGIFCDASSPSITNNTITLNVAHWFTVGGNGGGISCENNSAPTISGNTIEMNTSQGTGGGVYCNASSPTIDNCAISNNINWGILTHNGGIPIISHCNITDNTGEALENWDPSVTVVAENNWWGHATGPYHPDSNPGGLGDTVSDYVDFTPWLTEPVGVKEKEVIEVERRESSATIFSGPLILPEGKKCRVFDITGRVVMHNKIRPGIYFIEVDGKITQKVVKIR